MYELIHQGKTEQKDLYYDNMQLDSSFDENMKRQYLKN